MLYIIGNWKMQLSDADSEALAREIVRNWSGEGAAAGVTVVVCPSHLALEKIRPLTNGTSVALGAQDAFWEDKGTFTGEVSPKTLKEIGVEYCLVGHSERRQFLGETDDMVNKKMSALLRNGITPVICVGETMDERRAGKRDATVIGQVRAALTGVKPVGNQRIIVAYEPRWVIGSGQAVAPEDAAAVHHLILQALHEQFPADFVNQQCAVIYGGSVDAANVGSFVGQEVIHGVLVGGASLKAPEFVAIARAAADVR